MWRTTTTPTHHPQPSPTAKNRNSIPKEKIPISYQPYGYGLGDDLKIQFTKSTPPQIEESLLQGRGIGWRDEPSVEPNLPDPQKESSNRSECLEMVNMRNELRYQFALSEWINKAFLPQSVEVAEKAVEYLLANGSGLVRETLRCESNKILASRTISLNTQVTTHRDKKNALLFDADFFFGNHLGGKLLLPSLGVACHGLHGYSFHGPLRILFHGVAKFYFPPDLKEKPRRYSVAFWSRESSFSAVGRYTAYKDKEKKV
ncbi:uncharacterized protein PGTG_04624 [Puccinia graminis f. sp. tritici CRL 75-36-700-3]|uniref:Uncharacterized protein n=1 Tax=Puccinia graminis f. sp. tritici (strain CRL 75-36-700-3 / race SCCL) TaxID=418459 RepID=E3K2U9_PUCGT|nr:uncharacterized protein PGTG_04624 [Puccinia graminis f. sp. tritici CRL 75-36-700-3]EFP78668.2 hypothetical protein PGTG_04624 [Puccinia graminis f. sp. tritici CRL 75-36-700-3]